MQAPAPFCILCRDTNGPEAYNPWNAMSEAIIQRVRHPALSLWQSSAMAAAHIQLSLTKPPGVISTQDLLSHSLVRAASDHARGAVAGTPVAGPPLERSTPDSAYLSSLYFNLAMARATKDTVREQSLAQETRKYSTADTAGWETCGSNFAYYLSLDGGRIYNSWQGKDKGLQFLVIDYRLPNDAVVAVLGDWGTGMDDAAQLLKTVLRQHHPHAIIHLGDIYYSGTPQGTQDAPDYRGECRNNFLQVLTETFNEVLGLGQRVPVFTIPGNHEYYCMGVGYYTEVRPQVNQGLPDAYQPASFFCLRTQDDLWQFLGMDTGYNDYNPLYLFDPVDAAPSLQPNEATWHIDKLDNFTGKMILLSHHQLFSANVKLNGGETLCQANINNGLQALFAPYLSNHVAAWLWGHEHNLVLYQNGLLGLRRARLIGASSYEETTGESPYQVNYPDIPYLDAANFQLEAQNGYYNHSYAVIEFKRAQPDDPIKISYYQYPSWGGSNDIPPQTATLMFTEPLEVTKPPVGVPIAYSRPLFMQLSGYGYLGARVIDYRLGGPYDFPTLSPGAPVPLALQGGGGPISDGDTVQVFSLERPLEASALGAWDIPALYYYGGFGSPNQQWTVHKRDTSVDKIIRFEDELSFTNQQYADQGLCPLQVDPRNHSSSSGDILRP